MGKTVDIETGNFIGEGELATKFILQHLTKLPIRGLKHFPYSNGIYKQVPVTFIFGQKDMDFVVADTQMKSSVDLVVLDISCDKAIAIRVQGKGHGAGKKRHGKYTIKGTGKPKSDEVQKKLLEQYCHVVDIMINECPNVFKERTNEDAIQEIRDSFNTAKVKLKGINL